MIELAPMETLALSQLDPLDSPAFEACLLAWAQEGGRLVSLLPLNDGRLIGVMLMPISHRLRILATTRADYQGLSSRWPAAHPFERGLLEAGHWTNRQHPWPKSVVELLPPDHFFQVAGEEVHEVAVGPVHAGIIEPGHFRFQCDGEAVLHLEIALGYQHRGIEKALVGGPHRRTLVQMETVAGDTSIGHATAYCHLLESLAGTRPSARAQSLRAVLLELERLANHVGDLGALAADVGFLPTASYCGRLRGEFLNATALLCGNRFGRSAVTPGGVLLQPDDATFSRLSTNLRSALKDVREATKLLFGTPSVMGRLENTGPLNQEQVQRLGLVGPAARATGAVLDVRHDFPTGAYAASPIPIQTANTGDVYARAQLRWLEIQASVAYIEQLLDHLPTGAPVTPLPPLATHQLAVSLVEGWRGEIAHLAVTDGDGRFAAYQIVDPSMHNWFGLAIAMRGQQISDFPLCNKSFNLSYCGHDR